MWSSRSPSGSNAGFPSMSLLPKSPAARLSRYRSHTGLVSFGLGHRTLNDLIFANVGAFQPRFLEQFRKPCRPRHPYAVPRTYLQCVCTRRRNRIALLSPSRRLCASSDGRFSSPELTRFGRSPDPVRLAEEAETVSPPIPLRLPQISDMRVIWFGGRLTCAGFWLGPGMHRPACQRRGGQMARPTERRLTTKPASGSTGRALRRYFF